VRLIGPNVDPPVWDCPAFGATTISTAVGDAPVDGLAEESHGRGAFLMQAAAGDPDLAAVMPSTEVVDAVLGSAAPASGSSDCLILRAMLEQELTMMELMSACAGMRL